MNALRFPALGDIPVRYREQVQEKLGVRTHRVETDDPKETKSKYRNTRTLYEGEWFDSLKELNRWKELKLLEKTGEITGLRRQVSYQLRVKGIEICVYRCDFQYEQGGAVVVCDVKGMRKGLPYRLFKVKSALMLACYGLTVIEV